MQASTRLAFVLVAIGGVFPTPLPAQIVLKSGFDSEPGTAWTFSGSGAPGWNTGGFLQMGAGQSWRSPSFPVSSLEYLKISYRTRLSSMPTRFSGTVSTISINPNPTWNFDSRHPGPGGHDLIASDTRSTLSTPDEWTEHSYYSRVQENATDAAIGFGGDQGTSLQIDDIRVERVTDRASVSEWADAIWADRPKAAGMQTAPEIPVSHDPAGLRLLPRTATALSADATLRLVMLGDSIVNDAASSTLDVLIERSVPGVDVELVTAVGGSAGLNLWNPQNGSYPFTDSTANASSLHFDEAVIDQHPDLVILGGISTPATAAGYQGIRDVISKIRSDSVSQHLGYTPDILLTTGAFGYAPWAKSIPGNPAILGNVRGDPGLVVGSAAWCQAWCPTDQLDPSTTNAADYRSNLLRISLEMGTGFLDLTGIWGEYMILAQGGTLDERVVDSVVYDGYFRDIIHADTYGKELLGRSLATSFAPLASFVAVPEPGGIATGLTAAACLAGWRVRRSFPRTRRRWGQR